MMTEKILITILTVTTINTLLAVLLVLAEKIFANYGRLSIVINKEKTLDVEGGSSLLSTLNSQKIFLPSACGGRGTCGYCKCRILEGGGPLLPTEEPLLSESEIEDNMRIACQVKVKHEMTLVIPDELFNIQEYEVEVVMLENLTHDIKRVRLKFIEPDEIHFKAGQYIQLHSKPYPGVKSSVSRAYSIASSTARTDSIDLMIRLVPDGICTTWVHSYLKTSDRVKIVGPMGDFHLREGEDMVMIAGGSGMAPMIPILDALVTQKSKRKITYFFGALSKKDLFYTDEMAAFERQLSGFRFVPALSEPLPEDQWTGETGLITHPLENFLKETQTGILQAYLCGSPGMIHACCKLLRQYGVADDRIFFDPFA